MFTFGRVACRCWQLAPRLQHFCQLACPPQWHHFLFTLGVTNLTLCKNRAIAPFNITLPGLISLGNFGKHEYCMKIDEKQTLVFSVRPVMNLSAFQDRHTSCKFCLSVFTFSYTLSTIFGNYESFCPLGIFINEVCHEAKRKHSCNSLGTAEICYLLYNSQKVTRNNILSIFIGIPK